MSSSADTAHQLIATTARRLLARAAHGDADAFATFYDLTSGPVHRLSLALSEGAADAERLTVEVYLRAWREADRYDAAGCSPLAWLLVLTRDLARTPLAAA